MSRVHIQGKAPIIYVLRWQDNLPPKKKPNLDQIKIKKYLILIIIYKLKKTLI